MVSLRWFRRHKPDADPRIASGSATAGRGGHTAGSVPPEPHIPTPASPARPRRILFINQYYWPDHASTAQHLADLAESLADRGIECHVVCAQGTYKPGEPKSPRYEVHRGVHIHRVPATSLGRKSTLARMTDYLSFYARAVVASLTLPRFDTVVTLTTPPIIGLVGNILKAVKGTHHVYWSMDLHPDASLALGRMSPRNPVARALRWISDAAYRRADQVVVLGPYMADRISAKGVLADRISTIPVWSRRDEIFPVPRDGHPLRKSLGLEKQFIAMYSGNLGLAHTSDEFIEAAKRLRDRTDIVFLFVGGGPRLREVRESKEAHGLENIRLLDYFPREQLHHSLTLADVHLISMRPEMTGIVVPGKLYGAMAASRPTVFVGPKHCETADTIRQTGSGITVERGDTDGFVDAILRLSDDPSIARRMGERGRSAFLAGYEKRLCCDHWNELLTGALLEFQPKLRAADSPVTQGLYS